MQGKLSTPFANDGGYGCYAVKVRSRAENTVGSALRHKGYVVLVPSYIDQRRYSDRFKEVSCALFPGYVFVWLNARELLPLVSTDGVSYVVKSGNSLQPLPPDEVSAITSLSAMQERCMPCDLLGAGPRVVIESGPLLGQRGLLVHVGDKDRVVIPIPSIFSAVSIDVQSMVIRVLD